MFDPFIMAPVEQLVPGKGNFFTEPLAKTGAGEKKQIFGQMGLDHGPEWYSAKIINLDTNMPTDSDMARRIFAVSKSDSTTDVTELAALTVNSVAGTNVGDTRL